MKNSEIISILDEYIPNPKCSLDYKKDYELLFATVLSAQCTDERVNKVTPYLFNKYNLEQLAKEDEKVIEEIIRPCGSQSKKSKYLIKISKRLINEQNGKVPNDRTYLESLPGVGRKVANVVLYNLFNEPTIAVDTHVERVSKRLGFASKKDTPLEVEKKLMKKFDKEMWGKLHHQILLFGRHFCTARNPKCDTCKFKSICKEKKC